MPTVREIFELLERGKITLPPLSLRLMQIQPQLIGNRQFDALVELSWGSELVAKFAVDIKSLSTPRVFQNALTFLKSSSFPQGYWPMLIMPFLNNQQLKELERLNISGIDLCGNCVVLVPGKFGVFRTGEKNRFPNSAPIKNIYRKNSSMVGRVFLARSVYDTVQEVWAEINRRNILLKYGDRKLMSLSTVSKSLKTLEEDLIIERSADIRLLQADKLLEKLSDNYIPPKIKERVRLKMPIAGGAIQELLQTESQKSGLPFVATGTSSVLQYAVMHRGEMLSVYCPRLEMLVERLRGIQSDRFPNLELVETEDETVYFDARRERTFWWASPVQAYLELMAGDKRDRETAGQVKSLILKNLKSMQP